ncbi:hypothetical protein DOM21_18935 [Bacteriovorax stolpii]|uniref:Uncharacterized protein n=1 Tax=Bacteriovorax stolpii TaxID=960 RepID=A0A2K9NNE3_BACTC|nr:hypothetical protein [Bacteriovorax stolpii]AUN96575.1 hypothetical protein C0V70_00335 [Bacteriovorax stolpii]QDK43493.1 hypothetical protein DOM21_18935 [Bacteriovorax stolpii]TDP53904.1 hypothetical protein C8D79_1182 [Bacteriovorax stolpii]
MSAIHVLSKSFSHYRSRIQKRKDILSYAKHTSTEEIIFNLQRLVKLKDKKDVLKTLLSITNSSIWLSRSAFTVLKSYFDISSMENLNLNSERAQEIISCVTNKRSVDATDSEVFQTIYHELAHSHLVNDYRTSLKVPEVKVTIVLVSGVFNEIFSTPAFKRGAETLLDQYDIKHIAPVVDGRKGARENSLALKKQIEEYIEANPNERLWFFCFSKGGVDTLHYLRSKGDKLSENIIGVSFIATPIMGSDHINNKLLKLANTIGKVPENVSKKVLGKDVNLIASELQKSLSKNFRESWFKKNHKQLPSRLFYTAIAFESKWHQSHVWMMLTKAIFRSQKSNDGIVDVENAQFPFYFNGHNLGVLEGHHLVGSRSSFYDQEALMKAHLIYLDYKNLL